MSTNAWRNIIPRRKYRERRQLKRRKHLGHLEKKQDYKKRAVEYHKKEKQMENLREKALNKNPDEFYYNMVNAKMVDGEHKIFGKKGNDDTNKNLALVNLTKMVQKKKAERLQSQLHLLDIDNANTHTYFVSNKGQIKHKLKEIEKLKQSKQERKEEIAAKIAVEKFNGDEKAFEHYYSSLQREKKKQYNSKDYYHFYQI